MSTDYRDYTVDELKRGLEVLGPGFLAQLCYVCKGAGQYEQRFTAGCGMGSYRSMDRCDTCWTPPHYQGSGVLAGDKPAPESVVAQIVAAARRNPATETQVTLPNPGSPEAIKQGCLCPEIDNHYGRGLPTQHGEPSFIQDMRCPLHGRIEVAGPKP